VCAAEIGSRDPENLKGIIFESGFASIYNMMTRLFRVESPILTPDYVQRYSNDTRVKKFRKPVLIIHGTRDWIIPSTESELLYENLPDKIDKKLIMIDGAGHNDILSRENEYFTPLTEFISKNK
jgi:pimeloyl-ACP methyl ester carboxylesterase